MIYKLFLFTFSLFTLLLFGCYPQETDMIEVIEVEMPIDTIQISEGVSKFIIADTEYSREGFGRYCESVDEFTGEETTEILIFNGSPSFQGFVFDLELNDVALLEDENIGLRLILVNSDVEGEPNLYQCDADNSQLVFTTVSDSEIRGTWEGLFEKRIGEDIWEEYGVISGEFFVPVIDANCE